MINFFRTISLTSSGAANLIIDALLFEIAAFIAVPLAGIIVNSVIVSGIRRIVARIVGNKFEFILSNYFLFIGVVIHELSHALFALITGAQVTEVALFNPDGKSLGHVNFVPRGDTFVRALQSSFSSCAPVVVGIISSYFIITKLFPMLSELWHWIVCIYILVSIVFHMDMSPQDLKIYFKGAVPLLCIFLPISLILFFII